MSHKSTNEQAPGAETLPSPEQINELFEQMLVRIG